MASVSSPVVVCAIDITAAGRLVANMLEQALGNPPWLTPSVEEGPHAREDNARPPHETGLSVSPPIHDGPSPSSSREYRTPICAERESLSVGLARGPRADLGWRFGNFGNGADTPRGLQDFGRRCVDGQSGRGVCTGSLASLTFQHRLASLTGTLCAHGDANHRRRWLLQSRRLQRSTVIGPQGNDVASGVALSARAPPRRQAQ